MEETGIFFNSESTAQARFMVGESDFESCIRKGALVVDKSLFIKEILDDGALVKIIIRPRGFGKTLNSSMLQYFFSNTSSPEVRSHFERLKIARESPSYMKELGKYPVIRLNFKDLMTGSIEEYRDSFKSIIAGLYNSFLEELSGNIPDLNYYDAICDGSAGMSSFKKSLRKMTKFLYKKYKHRTIVLIDGYDDPIVTSKNSQIKNEIYEFLSLGIKGNKYLQQAVIFGVLALAEDIVFSNLNNFVLYDSTSKSYSTCFGFTRREIAEYLPNFVDDDVVSLEKWCGGYNFGSDKLFNPWVVVNLYEIMRFEKTMVLKNCLFRSDDTKRITRALNAHFSLLQGEFLELASGGSVRRETARKTDLSAIEYEEQDFWTFLVQIGYLTIEHYDSEGSVLRIPNEEVFVFHRNYLEKGPENISSSKKSVENPTDGIERHGLFFHKKKDSAEQQAAFTREIRDGFYLGEAKGKGDCFFDACAQKLNEMSGREEYTIKSLRLLCHEYAVALDKRCGHNPSHPDNWIGKALNDGARYLEYLANIRYTVEERETGEGVGDDRLAIWGEQHIDGRIICEKLGIKLHVIEVQENPDDETNKVQKFIVNHNVIDNKGLRNLDGEGIDWSDKDILHIAACNLHFVPILKMITKQKNRIYPVEVQMDKNFLPAQISAKNDDTHLKSEESVPVLFDQYFIEMVAKSESVKGKEVVLVVGHYGSGKSSVINYLLQCEMVKRENDVAGSVIDVEGEKYAEIGHEVFNVVGSPIVEGVYGSKDSKVTYCEIPLPLEECSEEQKVFLALSARLIVNAAKLVRAVIVVVDGNAMMSNRGNSLIHVMNQCGKFLFKDFIDMSQSVQVVVTKTREGFSLVPLVSFFTEMTTRLKLHVPVAGAVSLLEPTIPFKTIETILKLIKNNFLLINFLDKGTERTKILSEIDRSEEIPRDKFVFGMPTVDVVTDTSSIFVSVVKTGIILMRKRISFIDKIETCHSQLDLLWQECMSFDYLKTKFNTKTLTIKKDLKLLMDEFKKDLLGLEDRKKRAQSTISLLNSELSNIDTRDEEILVNQKIDEGWNYLYSVNKELAYHGVPFLRYELEPKDKFTVQECNPEKGDLKIFYSEAPRTRAVATVKIYAQRRSIDENPAKIKKINDQLKYQTETLTECDEKIYEIERKITELARALDLLDRLGLEENEQLPQKLIRAYSEAIIKSNAFRKSLLQYLNELARFKEKFGGKYNVLSAVSKIILILSLRSPVVDEFIANFKKFIDKLSIEEGLLNTAQRLVVMVMKEPEFEPEIPVSDINFDTLGHNNVSGLCVKIDDVEKVKKIPQMKNAPTIWEENKSAQPSVKTNNDLICDELLRITGKVWTRTTRGFNCSFKNEEETKQIVLHFKDQGVHQKPGAKNRSKAVRNQIIFPLEVKVERLRKIPKFEQYHHKEEAQRKR